MERECLPGVRAKCPDCDGPQCTYSPGSQCEEENLNYIAPDVRAELEAYRATGLTPETVVQLKGIAEIFNCDPADPAQLKSLCVKLRELARAERDGRLVVLVNEVTVDELHALFRKLNEQNEQQGDCAETYTTGYRNGHRNGQIELLVRLLGFPDPHGGVTEAAVEQLKGEGEHG